MHVSKLHDRLGEAAHAALVCERFDGEDFDPKDRGRGASVGTCGKKKRAAAVRSRGSDDGGAY